jgi:protein required for attachment to host cells
MSRQVFTVEASFSQRRSAVKMTRDGRVENAQAQHAKKVAEHLARIVHEDRITQIVIAGIPKLSRS